MHPFCTEWMLPLWSFILISKCGSSTGLSLTFLTQASMEKKTISVSSSELLPSCEITSYFLSLVQPSLYKCICLILGCYACNLPSCCSIFSMFFLSLYIQCAEMDVLIMGILFIFAHFNMFKWQMREKYCISAAASWWRCIASLLLQLFLLNTASKHIKGEMHAYHPFMFMLLCLLPSCEHDLSK